MIAIGALEPQEADAAVALWQACGLTRPWNDPHADLKFAFDTPTSTILAGRIDGKLAATVMVGFDGHRGWVYYLAVDPTLQRGGHGAVMMRAAEDWLRGQGVPKLNLMVRGDNAVATGFYEAIGYDRSDVIVLQKFLDA
ncbi:GNAT family acetyltransferase [Sphingoaurantiacus capsulatus]|uniref:GNAT family acetyltransferase n=1 Tax=Sphingoaurantiacus capsulatus TaxID=1771310 RepID=A0ABV7XF19_9SPHN